MNENEQLVDELAKRITFPADLPVSQHAEEIARAIETHQVVVIAGETGSGKTTQIPKICLQLGRGRKNQIIGHTQPRRIAARAVASRIAEEIGEQLGEGTVGYQVRFNSEIAEAARLKLMTDGILLAEMQRDRLLKRYDTIIIDEAHERSLNIDVILGYLKQILPKRPDLKVIITSATIDQERFAKHFSFPGKPPVPIIEVSGRTYPVEIRYRPLVLEAEVDAEDDLDDIKSVVRDETEAITAAYDELCAEGPGDILVFLPGEREIREVQEALAGHAKKRGDRTEILPLFSRLSNAEQQRIFSPPKQGSLRRVILATNVAETSLTVPGITYVIDSGLARISRFSQRTKVQRLPIEPISQASAQQRSGRAGRTKPGIAIRLFSESDFQARPEFTDPEILRTNLASVVLLMISLGLGDVARFPFLEPPNQRAVAEGVRLLEELGAITDAPRLPGGKKLTSVGKQLARFPLDPRLARMLLAADRLGCLNDVLTIVSGLSIQDPRERPLENEERAKQLHARFKDETSDFLSYLKLDQHLRARRKELSNSAFRKELKSEFLHYVRIREWWELKAQLKDMCRDAGLKSTGKAKSADLIHQALLSGLLSHIGAWDERRRDYQGARGTKFVLWPGSALNRKQYDLVMCSELVETSRLFGRTAAKIDPKWVLEAAGHVLKRSYSEPHWSRKKGAAMAHEKITLYGVTIIADQVTNFAKVDPALSREMFIRHALVEGDWETRHHFFRDNRALIAELEALQDKTRRWDLVVDDEQLFDFYDQRIPPTIVSAAHFDAWWKRTRQKQPQLLHLTKADLMTEQAPEAIATVSEDYPQLWVQDDLQLPLTYSYQPGGGAQTAALASNNAAKQQGRGVKPADGVTVTIALSVLNRVKAKPFAYLVPGMREELITELIRGLDKPIRKHLAPAPEKAKAVAQVMAEDDPQAGDDFYEVLADELVSLPNVPDDLPLYGENFYPEKLPEHLRMHFKIVDVKGKVIGHGDDLERLQKQFKNRVKQDLSQRATSITRTHLNDFPVTEIPRTYTQNMSGMQVKGYPALCVKEQEKDGYLRVDLVIATSEFEQQQLHRAGLIALLERRLPDPSQAVFKTLPNPTKMAIAQSSYASTQAMVADAARASVSYLLKDRLVWDLDSFDALATEIAADFIPVCEQVLRDAASALAKHHQVQRELKRVTSLSLLQQLTHVQRHADALVADGFIGRAGVTHLPEIKRYLEADLVRLDKMPENPNRDAKLAWEFDNVTEFWQLSEKKLQPVQRAEDAAREIPWMLQEFWVSLFAQTLGTKYTVSEKRIREAISKFTVTAPLN